MNPAVRSAASVLVIALTLLAAVTWTVWDFLDQREAARRAVADLQSATASAQNLDAIRPPTVTAGSGEPLGEQLSKKLDGAMAAAGIDAADLVRVSPQPSRQVGDGDLTEAASQIVFREVSLRQVLQLTASIAGADEGLRLREFHLSSGGEPAVGWNAELILSYLTSRPPRGDERLTSGQ